MSETTKPTNEVSLDALLDDALDDYERLSTQHPTTAATTTSSSTTTATSTTTTPQPTKKPTKQALFPPSQDDVEATLNAVLSQLTKIEPPGMTHPPVSTSATTTATNQRENPEEPTVEEDAAATEAVEKYIQALASTTTNNTDAPSTTTGEEAGEEKSAEAVVQLLRPFVSKEMLYPPLRELLTRFPAWLEKRKPELPEQEFLDRQKQLECLKRVCFLYEDQKTPDDHITEIVVLIEKMGQAPKELVEEASAAAAAATPTDGQSGQPLPPDCSIM